MEDGDMVYGDLFWYGKGWKVAIFFFLFRRILNSLKSRHSFSS